MRHRLIIAAALSSAALVAGCSTSSGGSGAGAAADADASTAAAGQRVTTTAPATVTDGTTVLHTLVGKLTAGRTGTQVDTDNGPNDHARWADTVWLRGADTGSPQGEADVDVYAATADRDAYVSEWASSVTPGQAYLLKGDSWTAQAFNAADAALIRQVLGGVTVTAGG